MEISKENKTTRNNGIDLLKCLCAFGVICIHSGFPGEFGKWLIIVSRSAVPIFFIITGYFMTGRSEKKQIIKILNLILGSNLLYFLLRIVESWKTLPGYFAETFTLRKISNFIFFNESPFIGHLWYLSAILYVLIISYLFRKLKKEKYLYLLTPFLLAVCLMFGGQLLGKEGDISCTRNFLFIGLPFFCIGNIICKYKISAKLKPSIWLILIAAFSVTSVLENMYLNSILPYAARDCYISTVFLSVSAFCYFNNKTIKNKFGEKLAIIGQKHSTNIYILHIAVLTGLMEIVTRLSIQREYFYVAPLIIFGISLLLSVFIKTIRFPKQIFRETNK